MIKLSINRPSLLVVLFAVLGVLAYTSYTRLSYEMMPSFSSDIIAISVIYPGAAPSEVESSVTKKIEDAVSSIEKIVDIESSAVESFSMTIVRFDQSADIDQALQDAKIRLDAIASTLPDNIKTPTLSKFSTADLPILNISTTSNLAATAFYDLVKNRIQPALARIDGVGQIQLLGGQEREIRVNVKKDALEQYGLSILQVVEVVQKANLEFPTGKVVNAEEEMTLRLKGKFQSLEDLRQLVVSTNQQGAAIRLYELAEVQDTQKKATDISRLNGKSSIALSITKRNDANSVEVSKKVRAELAELSEQYKNEALQFTVARDASEFTLEAVGAVFTDILIAIVLVALVMILFLHSFRNALIVMLSIPLSLMASVIAMFALDYSFNMMTLLGMSLVIGILVDDSIVVLENIFRHQEMGKDSKQAALDGSKEIFLTALSITLVLVIVFVPLSLAEGLAGNILRQFSMVVAISTLMSLFVSYTVAPALAARYSKVEHFKPDSFGDFVFGNFERLIQWLAELYAGVLAWCLRWWLVPMLVIGGLFYGSILLVSKGYIGSAFYNSGDAGEFLIQLELPKEATLKATNQVVQEIEQYLLAKKEVIQIFATVGSQTGLMFSGQASGNVAEINGKLIDKQLRTESALVYGVKMRNELQKLYPTIKIQSNQVSMIGGANDNPIQIIIGNVDFKVGMDYAQKMLDKLVTIPGVLEPELSIEESNPELTVETDRSEMATLGLDLQIVGATLQTAFAGNTDAKYREGGEEYDINIVLDAFDRKDQNDVSNLTFRNRFGQLIRLNQFGSIQQTVSTARIERLNRTPSVTVQSKVLGRPSGSVGADIQQWIADNPPPTGTDISYDGDLRRQSESFSSLGTAFLISFIFIYLIMVALYDSYLYPLTVMFSIPVGLIGALLALALVMETLNLFTILGIILLNGMVAKNAILLVDFANQAKEEGMNTRDALIASGKTRLRPILMTTVSLVIGMIPLATAAGAASEWKNGLAWVIIGGLMSSLFLSLILVPILYQGVDWMKLFFRQIVASSRLSVKPSQSGE